MNNSTDDIELIERYLDNDLSGKDLNRFEERLQADSHLAEELEQYKLTMKAVENSAIRNQLVNFHQEYLKENERRFSPYGYYIVAAATVSLILLGFYWTGFLGKSDQALFEAYFEPYENLISSRNTDFSQLEEGMQLYSAAKYAEAIAAFEKYPDNTSDELHFYRGISLLAVGRVADAIADFEKVRSGMYHQQAKWYLALSQLRAKQRSRAVETLHMIGAGDFNHQNAQELIEELQ